MTASRYALDLTKYHRRYTLGDVTVFLTWFGSGITTEPALVLAPTYKLGSGDMTPCVVTLDGAWRWSAEIGDPSFCAQASRIFARHLGLGKSGLFGAMRVTSIIQDHLGELILMPPDYRERVVVADAVLLDANGKEVSSEVLDRV